MPRGSLPAAAAKQGSKMIASTLHRAILKHLRRHAERVGRIRGWRQALLEMGATKFGPPNPNAGTLMRLNAIDDLPRLRRLAVRLLTAADWDELLADEPRRRKAP